MPKIESEDVTVLCMVVRKPFQPGTKITVEGADGEDLRVAHILLDIPKRGLEEWSDKAFMQVCGSGLVPLYDYLRVTPGIFKEGPLVPAP